MPLRVISSRAEMWNAISTARGMGVRIGIVPTMGALHAGHLRLVEVARESCELVVTTIFVNPTQFAPHEDLARYPRTLDRDLALLETTRSDLVFVPTHNEIYAPGFSTYVEPGDVARRWEGMVRPHHFRGVATVVLKLFQIIPAHLAYFGRKDYQQAQVVAQMVRDFDLPITLQIVPTVRDDNDLALSSRNAYLTDQDRNRASAIPRSLRSGQNAFHRGIHLAGDLLRVVLDELTPYVDQIDYVTIVDPQSLEPLDVATAESVMLVAVRIGNTRLIDNAFAGAATL